MFEGQLELLGHHFATLPLRVEIELNRKITEIKKLLVIEISYPPLNTWNQHTNTAVACNVFSMMYIYDMFSSHRSLGRLVCNE